MDKLAAHIIITYLNCFPNDMKSRVSYIWEVDSKSSLTLSSFGTKLTANSLKLAIIPDTDFNIWDDSKVYKIATYLDKSFDVKSTSNQEIIVQYNNMTICIVLLERKEIGNNEYLCDSEKKYNSNHFRKVKLFLYYFKFPKTIVARKYQQKNSYKRQKKRGK
jgi:hypothetical protein